ncbi:MAG: hypothetical protein IPJ77_22030 [Planctomycetes bacterium]|nr:hypothetical protein [Planctomycetota bacterium]
MPHPTTHTTAGLLALACLALPASAQGLVATQGVIVATDGDAVPDNAGLPMSGFTFGGSSALGNNCVLDETGSVLFLGRMTDVGGTVTPIDERAYFYGSSRATLKMLVRGGAQAPGMTPGVLLRTGSGISTALSSTVRLSPDGRAFWGSTVWDNNVTITGPNDSGLFGGPFVGQTLLVQRNDVAPGTGGATYTQAFSSPSLVTTGINRQGRIYFQGALTNGTGIPPVNTTSGTNNQVGLWAGLPGALELVARKSDPVSGAGGAVAIDTFTTLSALMEMNDAGELLYDVTFSTTQGAPAATVANDRALMVHTPGAGSAVLVREGDVAPGTGGGTFNAITGDAWAPGIAVNSWTRSGKTLFATELRGGLVSPGVDDRAVYAGGVGTLAMVARKNDPAPGTDGVFATFPGSLSSTNVYSLVNDTGAIVLQATLSGGTVTTANDSGLWTGTPGNLQLVVREGQAMPGTGGSIASSFSSSVVHFNDRGQILFFTTLSGGTTTGLSLWAYNPGQGLIPVVLNGDQVEIAPAVFRTVSGFGTVQNGNSDGASLAFGHDGRVGLRVAFTGSTNAIMTVQLPNPVAGTPFCFGDGIDTSHTTPCPCANNGTAGNGCANSVNASGANLGSSGSTFGDDVVLLGSLMPSTSSCIYLQGDALDDVSFGDGVRCAGGNLIRLRTRFNVAGASAFPDSTDTITLSARGGVTPGSGDVRYYQTYYRNAAGLFCPPETFNVTNGVAVTW